MTYPYETATPEQRRIGAWWWLIHHGVRLERLTEPVEDRVAYIRTNKSPHEIEPRLCGMRPVVGPLPAAVVEATAARDKAYAKAKAALNEADAALAKVGAAHAKANPAVDKALAAHGAEIEALFRKECPDVQWGPDGMVFPQETKEAKP